MADVDELYEQAVGGSDASPEERIDLLSEAIDLAPEDARLWTARARIRAANFNWQRDAYADITKALELDASSAEALIWDVVIRRRLAQTRGLWKRAALAAVAAKDASRESVVTFCEDLYELLKADTTELDLFITTHETVIEHHPVAVAHLNMSEAYAMAGRPEDAEAAAARAKEIDSAATTMLQLARRAKNGTLVEAVPVADRLAEMNADELRGLLRRVITLLKALPDQADSLESRGDWYSFLVELSGVSDDLTAGQFHGPGWFRDDE